MIRNLVIVLVAIFILACNDHEIIHNNRIELNNVDEFYNIVTMNPAKHNDLDITSISEYIIIERYINRLVKDLSSADQQSLRFVYNELLKDNDTEVSINKILFSYIVKLLKSDCDLIILITKEHRNWVLSLSFSSNGKEVIYDNIHIDNVKWWSNISKYNLKKV